jgi:hypothetical protein
MKIHKLLLGILCTCLLVSLGPFALARLGLINPISNKSWLVLLLTGGGLLLKALVGDVASGEFLWHKYGYDNCILTFGSCLTALVLQLTSKSDLFPGLSTVPLLRGIPADVSDPAHARDIQLFVFFFVVLIATLLTAKISGAIRESGTVGKSWLAAINWVVGLFIFGVYLLVLLTKA